MWTSLSPRVDRQLAAARMWVLIVATTIAASVIPLDELLAQDKPSSSIDTQTAPEPGEDVAASGNSDKEPPDVYDVRVSSFQSVTPGKTTLAEVKQSLGQPLDQEVQGDHSTFIYKIGPFPQVEISARLDVVSSIVIHLASLAAPDEVAKDLGLSAFTPVPIENEEGEALGQAYPERGVVFSFAADSDDRQVSQLMLDPISAELFLLRAEKNEQQYELALADLDYVTKLDPNNALAHWRKARILAVCQQHEAALEAAHEAVDLEADPRFLLTRSALLFEMDQYTEALADTQQVLNLEDISDVVKARAECQLGDLLAGGPQKNFRNAIQHHQAAVELAATVASSEDATERQTAKRILIDAHLAIASDITRGNWSKKAETAPKWLRIANELAIDAIENDGGHPSLQLLVMCEALSAYAGMQGAVDPTEVIDKAVQQGQQLIDQTEDPLHKAALRWLLVEALFETVQIELVRGDAAGVLEYGQQAIKLLSDLALDPPDSTQAQYMIGRLYFYVGSTHAIRKNDHEQAVRLYEKALPYLSRGVPSSDAADQGLHGQRFVSMGVSYWQADSRGEGLQLTSEGLELMEQAHQAGVLEKKALAVPYSNLAAMHKSLGHAEKASTLAAKAAELAGPSDSTQQR